MCLRFKKKKSVLKLLGHNMLEHSVAVIHGAPRYCFRPCVSEIRSQIFLKVPTRGVSYTEQHETRRNDHNDHNSIRIHDPFVEIYTSRSL